MPDNFRLASICPNFFQIPPNFASILPQSSKIFPNLIEPNLLGDAVASLASPPPMPMIIRMFCYNCGKIKLQQLKNWTSNFWKV